ncbi:MAG TPA: NTP transferase domain-containing protein [Gemmatimonadales bacterium]|nr:NTP transferase domain-containing protein [Gemmatimonadales bacterium]
MHGLILAGGEGTRLAASGVAEPKALVPVGGTPQLVRLIRTFARLGSDSVTVALRDDVPPEPARCELARLPLPSTLLRCHTPSSLHTLAVGLEAVPPGPVFCSMVDTVMPWADWARAHDAARRALDPDDHHRARCEMLDAILVVTPHVDDERPLHVGRDTEGRVREIGGAASDPPCVSGGLYGFGPRARARAAFARAAGMDRMRAFLDLLVRDGAAVGSVEIARIIDLDHRRDLDAANTWDAAAWQDSCE